MPLSDICSSIPLENVDRLIFATHEFTAQDLFSILEPKYSGDDILQKTQTMLFEEALPAILEKWAAHDRVKLHHFLQFCTGQSYLPDSGSDFKITVVFETKTVKENSSSDDRLPEM